MILSLWECSHKEKVIFAKVRDMCVQRATNLKIVDKSNITPLHVHKIKSLFENKCHFSISVLF